MTHSVSLSLTRPTPRPRHTRRKKPHTIHTQTHHTQVCLFHTAPAYVHQLPHQLQQGLRNGLLILFRPEKVFGAQARALHTTSKRNPTHLGASSIASCGEGVWRLKVGFSGTTLMTMTTHMLQTPTTQNAQRVCSISFRFFSNHMTDFASRLQELESRDPGLHLHILSYVDGDMSREQYANLMHKEMASTINGALVDDDVFLKVAGMLTSYQKIVGFGNEALFLAVNLAQRYVMHAVHPAVELPLVDLAALLLSMKLCDANFIPRWQVHKLALAAARGLLWNNLCRRSGRWCRLCAGGFGRVHLGLS